MNTLVDFVIDVMNGISKSKPVLFQRDGVLYVASQEGFGQVSYGLKNYPEEIREWEKREQPREIQESRDSLKIVKGKRVFKTADEPYLRAIVSNSDTLSITLDDIAKIAEKLSELPDDRLLRMISHQSRYHSHKYGYAADGIDVWFDAARTIKRETYLDLIRANEERLIDNMASLKGKESEDVQNAYERRIYPDVLVITPYLKLSVPRPGRIDPHRKQPDSWSGETRFSQNYDNTGNGDILYHHKVNTYRENPFGVHLDLNAVPIYSGFVGGEIQDLSRVREQVDVINANIPSILGVLDRLNEAHNSACEKDINWRNSVRRQKEMIVAQ